MNVKELEKYKEKEELILTDSDKIHIENYRQLINFFENSLQNSIKDGVANYNSLHGSCLQCIRFLDNLIHSYDISVKNSKYLNTVIDKIIEENTVKAENELGNEDLSQKSF